MSQSNKACLAFKITNWCNLGCRHCCEKSGPYEPYDFMNLSKVEKYLAEFKSLPIEKYNSVAFTGGEVMAPYYVYRDNYIPLCSMFAFENGMTPVLKTNGVWGCDSNLMGRIFSGFITVRQQHNHPVNLDISLDRFHGNIGAIANILDAVLANPEIAHSVSITLQGIRRNSSRAAHDLGMALLAHGINVYAGSETTPNVILTNGTNLYSVQHNFNQAIADAGRATDNKLGTFKLTGHPDFYGDSIMIDSNDCIRLNMIHAMKIDGRPLGECIQLLKEKAKQNQR